MDVEEIRKEAYTVLHDCVEELMTAGQIPAGGVVVLGCSTSEVMGGRIGKASAPEVGEIIAQTMLQVCAEYELHAAFQCCEHLNRAIVVEQEELRALGLTQVRAIPQPKAGALCLLLPGSICSILPWPCIFRQTLPLTWGIPWWGCTSARWRCLCAASMIIWDRHIWSWPMLVCLTLAAVERSTNKNHHGMLIRGRVARLVSFCASMDVPCNIHTLFTLFAPSLKVHIRFVVYTTLQREASGDLLERNA